MSNLQSAHTEDHFFAAQYQTEQRRRNAEIESRRRKFEQDFDTDLLPFSYPHLKRTGIRLSNLVWMQIMMKSVQHVVTHGFALSADTRLITKTLGTAHDVTVSMYEGPKYRCPSDLADLFFDGEVPIYQSHLSELGILVTKQQLASVKAQVVAEQMEREAYYD